MRRNSSQSSPGIKALAFAAILLLFGVFASVKPAYSQTIGFERDRARTMLETIRSDIKKNYYDPAFHGVDVDARFKKADEDIKAATALKQMTSIIAQTLLDFHDSHTFFIPPARYYRTEYGWQMQIIGEKCYVAAVKPGSDAEGKGIKEGDVVIAVNGYKPTRDSLWILQYYYNVLAPQPGMRLILQGADGKLRQVEVMAKIEQDKKLLRFEDMFKMIRDAENEAHQNRHRSYELGKDVFIWKMPQFDLSEEEVDQMMSKVKKHKAFILDLRGNPGGYVETLQRLIGHLFDHDIKIGDLKSRKESKPVLARTRGDSDFKGQVIVLVDSRSGSAAEVMARVVQLEKRGTIIGDRTAGAVMISKFYDHTDGQDIIVGYGVSVTDADLIMTDDKSLEGAGVVPDTLMLPTSADLAAKRDPVLARAASLVGINMDAEKAGTLFPLEWKK
jgi:C-terminal processing protease CtpA/Prc